MICLWQVFTLCSRFQFVMLVGKKIIFGFLFVFVTSTCNDINFIILLEPYLPQFVTYVCLSNKPYHVACCSLLVHAVSLVCRSV